MSDEAGAAPAAAEPVAAPVADTEVVSLPNPIDVQTELAPEPKVEAKPEPTKAPSIKEALEKAEKTVNAKAAAEKVDPKAEVKPKVEAKPDDNRDPETGKFKPKADSDKPADAVAEKPKADATPPAKSTYEAPKRFSEDARKVWDTAPDPVKAEVARMEREMTQGIEKHRERAEKWDALKEFDDIATKSGTTVKDAFARYVGMEQKLRGDLVGGLDEIVANATQGKYSLRDIAAHVMGQKPEEVQSQSDATIRELKATVAQIQQQVGGVVQTFTQQREQSTVQEINAFAAKPEHARFEELAEDIAFFMKSGRAKDLSEAYQLAERLNPAPAQATIPPKAAEAEVKVPDLAEQIRKGSKSPNGAPSAGSDPTTRTPSKSRREALDRAFATAG